MKQNRTEEDGPSPVEAIRILTQMFDNVTFDDIDATTDEGANRLLARWHVMNKCLGVLSEAVARYDHSNHNPHA